jgi:hypothetical protein
MAVTYEVKRLVGFRDWKLIYSGGDPFLAYNWAGYYATIFPKMRIILTEEEIFKNKSGKMTFHVSPPGWSRNEGILPRDFEICLSEISGDGDLRKSKIMEVKRDAESKRSEITRDVYENYKKLD